MLITKAEKTDLLHLGVREWEAQRADAIPVPDEGNCVLVWYDTLDRLPDVVVVEDGGMQRFLAWTTTYVPHLTPITALVEVAEHRTLGEIRAGRFFVDSVSPAWWDPAVTRGLLGLVHAEAAAACQGALVPLSAGMTPYISVFSWLALQREIINSDRMPLRTLRENWEEARRLLNARRLGYDPEHVEEVWALVTDSDAGGRRMQSRHLRQIVAFLDSVRSGMPLSDTLDVAQDHSSVIEKLQIGPLEHRVDLFRRLVESLYERRDPPPGHATVLGFALSLISQGSFSHVGLLGPSRVSDVRPLLWYGWFDFFRHAPEAASPPSSAASLQLLRALRRSCSPWSCRDIAVDELRVLSRLNDPFAECLLDTRHPIRVEIGRGAVSLIQPAPLRVRGRREQPSLFDEIP